MRAGQQPTLRDQLVEERRVQHCPRPAVVGGYAMNAACDQGAAGGVSDIAEQMRLTSGAALPDSGEVVSEIASCGV